MKKGLIIATSVIVLAGATTAIGFGVSKHSNSVSSSEPSVVEEVVTTEGVVDAREEATTEVVEETDTTKKEEKTTEVKEEKTTESKKKDDNTLSNSQSVEQATTQAQRKEQQTTQQTTTQATANAQQEVENAIAQVPTQVPSQPSSNSNSNSQPTATTPSGNSNSSNNNNSNSNSNSNSSNSNSNSQPSTPASTPSASTSSTPSTPSASTTPSTPAHVHNFVAKQVCTKEAWTETIEHPAEYKTEAYMTCRTCGAKFQDGAALDAHLRSYIDVDDAHYCAGWGTTYEDVCTKEAWTETINHPAEYKTVYECECGAIK